MGNALIIMAHALIEGATEIAETKAGQEAIKAAGRFLDEALESGSLQKSGDFERLLSNSPGGRSLDYTRLLLEKPEVLDDLAPSNIDKIIPKGMPEITPGTSGALFAESSDSKQLMAQITDDGRAYITAQQPGFLLRGGGWLQNIGPFERNRQLMLLPVGKPIPVGTFGDTIFKPANTSFKPIELQDIGSSIGGHYGLIVRESDRPLQRLIEDSVKGRNELLGSQFPVERKLGWRF